MKGNIKGSPKSVAYLVRDFNLDQNGGTPDKMHSTYNVEVRWVGSARVSPDPWRATSLHVNDGGAKAVDVRLGVMPSTEDHLWTHVHLKERKVV